MVEEKQEGAYFAPPPQGKIGLRLGSHCTTLLMLHYSRVSQIRNHFLSMRSEPLSYRMR